MGVYIYGTGKTALKIWEILNGKGVEVCGFLQKKDFDSANNYPDYVAELGTIYDFNDDRIIKTERQKVYIAIENASAPIREIIQRLRIVGWQEIISYSQMIDIYPDVIPRFFYLEPRSEFAKRRVEIENVRRILHERVGDQKTCEIFDAIVQFRYTKDYDDLPEIDHDIYFPEDILGWWTSPVCFVDCGAFDGDTLKSAANKFPIISKYIALEPDLNNFEKLKVALTNNIEQISMLSYGVWNKSETLHFSASADVGSHITEDGNQKIHTICLDELLVNEKPSHIKMDIEGAEYNAIIGAEHIIKKNKPKLAISIYHRPEDIYEIPLLLEKWNLGYKYYLRTYMDTGFDTVLYAI